MAQGRKGWYRRLGYRTWDLQRERPELDVWSFGPVYAQLCYKCDELVFLGSCSAWVAGQWRWDKNVTLGLPSPSASICNSWKLLGSVLTAARTQNSMNDRHCVTQFLVACNWGEGGFLCLPLSLCLSIIYLRIGGRRKCSDQLHLPSELRRWERAAVVGTMAYAIHPSIPTTIK